MALTVQQLITEPTREEVRAKIYEVLGYLGVNVTGWQSGNVLKLMIAVFTAVIVLFVRIVARANRSNFLDTATGSGLTNRAKQNYNVDYIGATRATTTLTLSNTSGGIYTLDPGELIVKDTDTYELYQNTSTFTLGALQTGLDIPIEAIEAGSASSSAAGKLTVLVTTLSGVTCTNASAAIGLDGQTADEVRQLCRDSLGRLSPHGPEAAYVYFAKIAARADGSPIGVTRVKVSPYGVPVYVTVASAGGVVTGDKDDTATDLGRVQLSIDENVIDNGVTSEVSSATEVELVVTATIYVDRAANLDGDEVEAAGVAALNAYIPTIPIEGFVIPPAVVGYVFQNSLEGVLESLEDLAPYIIKADVTNPDTALAAGEVFTAGAHDLNVVHVTVKK